MGAPSALKIFELGEEHGRSEYQAALANDNVSDDAKELIRRELLPSLEKHMIELQQRRDNVA